MCNLREKNGAVMRTSVCNKNDLQSLECHLCNVRLAVEDEEKVTLHFD